MYIQQRQYEEASTALLEQVKLLEHHVNDKERLKEAYGTLGFAKTGLGHYETALDYCTRALQLSQELNDAESSENQQENIEFLKKKIEEKSEDPNS